MKKQMTIKQLCFVAAVVLTLLLITAIRFQDVPRHRRLPLAYTIEESQWKTLPTLELAVRMGYSIFNPYRRYGRQIPGVRLHKISRVLGLQPPWKSRAVVQNPPDIRGHFEEPPGIQGLQ